MYSGKRIRSEVAATLFLAGPVVLAMLGQNSMSFIDTVMVGRLGSEALAGMALGGTVYFFVQIVCNGAVIAVGPLVSQAFGAREYRAAGRTVRQGLWLGFFLTIPAVLFLYNAAPVLRLLGQAESSVRIAESYLRSVVWGFLPATWYMAMKSFVEGVTRPWPVTLITFTGVGLNIVADYVLMFGKWGFPALGVAGTGIATSIVFWYLFTTLSIYVSRRKSFDRFEVFKRFGLPDPHYFKELFRIGWPIGVSHGIESGLFMVTAILMGTLGSTVLAAHQVAIQCASLSFMVPLGFGIATSVRVGHAVGRRDVPGVQSAGFTGIALAATFMLGAAILFWTVPETIIGIFLDTSLSANRSVVELAVYLLGVAAVFQVFDGVQVAAAGALRGLKDTRTPMLIGFFSYWMVGLTTGCVAAFVLGGGALGLWWGLVVGLATASVLLTLRFRRKAPDVQYSPPSSTVKTFQAETF